MTTPLAWLVDTNVVSEMMRRQPEPRVAACLDSIADEASRSTVMFRMPVSRRLRRAADSPW